MADFTMTVLGSGSALPMHGRHPAAQVVQHGEFFCLIDCGEGTQERIIEAGIKPFKISVILISHLHGDHIFGLPGLLSSFSLIKRTEELTIYGPPGLKGLLEAIFMYSELKIAYPLTLVEINPAGLQRIMLMDTLDILTFPLYHRVACNGYMVRETAPAVKIRKEVVHDLDLSHEQLKALKRGEDILYKGKLIRNAELTFGPEKPVSYAYCSDTRNDSRLLSWIKGVSVLYYETTFMGDMAPMAEQTGHSTSIDAGRVAAAVEASCLITGHYSSRYKVVNDLLAEAQGYFNYVLAAEEGRRYDLRALARGMAGI